MNEGLCQRLGLNIVHNKAECGWPMGAPPPHRFNSSGDRMRLFFFSPGSIFPENSRNGLSIFYIAKENYFDLRNRKRSFLGYVEGLLSFGEIEEEMDKGILMPKF
jgi:hypothetical protein